MTRHPKAVPAAASVLDAAKQALEIEIRGLQALIPRLGAPFEQAVEMILDCGDREGKVVVTGMGKSGHIGNKIAATLASTGTMAFFLHPGEAIHGDLGMVRSGDVVLAISNSGQTEEVIRLLGPFRRIGLSLIAMTGNAASELASRADIHLDVSVAQEACPHDLAPTASTTAALAMGDALAVCLLRERGFSSEDYALFHPGGGLGKKLVTTVADLMDSGDQLPLVQESTSVKAVLPELQAKHYGITAVVDEEGKLSGIFSMGDLTRLHLKDPSLDFMNLPISSFMTRDPRMTTPGKLAAQALNTMETHKIRALIVVDDSYSPIGVIGLYEVLRAIDY